MQKQNANKSAALGIVIGLIAVIVVAALALAWGLGWFSGGQQQEPPTEPTQTEPSQENTEPGEEEPVTLYWNLDRQQYINNSESGLSSRQRDDIDNLYHILFAVDGRSVYRLVDDPKVVNRIDAQDVMGLVFDDKGLVIDVQAIDEITGGIAYNKFYVDTVEGNKVVINSSPRMDGVRAELTITDDIRVYDVSGSDSMVGEATEVKANDVVVVIKDKQDNISHIYVVAREMSLNLYYNVTRMWNSTLSQTTRLPDENGEYSIVLAVNGEQVTLKSKSIDAMTQLDSVAARCLYVDFDNEGYITGGGAAWGRTGGKSFASYMDVISIDGRTVTAKKVIEAWNTGATDTGTMMLGCQVYDCSGTGEFVGVATELRVSDRIQGVTNARGEICAIYIVNRLVDSDIYWNLERKWDSETNKTTRTKSSDGYYHFLLATNGRQIDVKTADYELANSIEAMAARCFGLKLDGNIITKLYPAPSVTGGASTASWFDVMYFTGGNSFFAKKYVNPNPGQTVTVTMAENCKVYNVTTNGYINFAGELTNVRVGDRVHCLTNADGEAIHIFVINRYADVPVYWNESRKYNSTTKETSRPQAEDGYYYFTMASEGKYVTLKTDDKEIATQIDSQANCTVGLDVNGDVITKVYAYTAVNAIRGGSIASWYDVTSLNGRTAHVYKYASGSDTGKEYDMTLASNVKIYNVSGIFEDHYGEVTKLKVGDRIQAYKNIDGDVGYVFVVSSNTHGSVYHMCEHCGQNVYWSSWNGSSNLTTSGHYYLDRDQEIGSLLQVGSTSANAAPIEVTICLAGRTISSSDRVFTVHSNATLNIVDHDEGTGVLTGKGRLNATSGKPDHSRMMMINGGTVNLYGGTFTARDDAYDTPNGGVIGVYGGGTLNVYGGAIVANGAITGNGGAVTIGKGTVNLNGGTVIGGEAANGGAIYVTANQTLNLNGGTVKGGKAANGGGIFAADGSTVSISGAPVIADNEGSNLYFSSGVLANLGTMTEGAKIGVTVEAGYGFFTTETAEANAQYFFGDDGSEIHYQDGALFLGEPVQAHTHSVWGVEGEHDHDGEDLVWQPWGSGNSLPTKAGNYFLTRDVEVKTYTGVLADQDVKLCLNGFTVTYDFTSSGRLYSCFEAGASLTVTDCSEEETGKLLSAWAGSSTGSGKPAQGAVVWVRQNTAFNLYRGTLDATTVEDTMHGVAVCVEPTGTFNMYGGHILGGLATRPASGASTHSGRGGAVAVSGTFNLYDGTISGGRSQQFGGNVFVTNSGVFNMYGGSISGGESPRGGNVYANTDTKFYFHDGLIENGKASEVGGNVMVFGKTTFEMTGGTITGGTAANGGNLEVVRYVNGTVINMPTVTVSGGTITGSARFGTGTTATLSGAAVISGNTDGYNLYLGSGVLLNLSELSEGAKFGITLENGGGAFTTATDEANIAYFYPDSDQYNLVYNQEDGALCLDRQEVVSHIHSVWGVEGAHDHDSENIEWQPWDSANSLPTTAGNYYLTQNIHVTSYTGVLKNQDVKLCLNGFTVTYDFTSSGRLYACFEEGAHLTVTDCSEEETGKLFSNWIGTSAGSGKPAQGAVVWVRGKTTFDLYRGTLDGSTVVNTMWGAAVCIEKTGTFNMYGGTILGGTVNPSSGNANAGTGGAVFVLGEFNMYDGLISGGRANRNASLSSQSGRGGAVAIADANAVFHMYGGTIEKGSAQEYGGNVYIMYGKFYLHDGTVRGGESSGAGGNIYVNNNTEFHMYGGTIEGGKATGAGGNVRIFGSAIGEITGGEIRNGQAGGNGGNLEISKYSTNLPTITLSNVSITGGKSNASGGGVFVGDGAKVTVSGKVVIQDDETTNLYLSNGVLLNLGTLVKGTDIGVTMQSGSGAFTAATDEANIDFFHSDSNTAYVAYKDGALCLETKSQDAHIHSECLSGDSSHDHSHAEIIWEPWLGTDSLPKAAADAGHYYYLTQDITIKAQQSIAANTDIHLCLNGHTVTYDFQSNSRLYSIHNSGAALSITDCSTDPEKPGKLVAAMPESKNSVSGQGTLVWVRESGFAVKTVFNLYGGVLDASSVVNTMYGTGVCADINTTFNMYGGTIIGGTVKRATDSDTNGRGGSVFAKGTFTMYDGTITGGRTAGQEGGGVYATEWGGNVYVHTPGKFIMKGGLIEKGSAHRGGNVFIGNASNGFTLENGTIEGGIATDAGGNVYIFGTNNFTMTGGTIKDGQAATGDNLRLSYVSANANFPTFNFSGGKIIGGKTEGGSSVYALPGTTINLSGSAVISGHPKANLYLSSGVLLNVNALTKGADIGVTLAAYGPFTNPTAEENLQYFHADKEGETVTRNADGQLEILAPITIAAVAGGMIQAVRETVQALI